MLSSLVKEHQVKQAARKESQGEYIILSHNSPLHVVYDTKISTFCGSVLY